MYRWRRREQQRMKKTRPPKHRPLPPPPPPFALLTRWMIELGCYLQRQGSLPPPVFAVVLNRGEDSPLLAWPHFHIFRCIPRPTSLPRAQQSCRRAPWPEQAGNGAGKRNGGIAPRPAVRQGPLPQRPGMYRTLFLTPRMCSHPCTSISACVPHLGWWFLRST